MNGIKFVIWQELVGYDSNNEANRRAYYQGRGITWDNQEVDCYIITSRDRIAEWQVGKCPEPPV